MSLRSLFLMPALMVMFTLGPTANAVAGGDGGESDWIRDTGDILQIALPVLGGGATFFTNPDPDKMWDKDGTWMFAKSFGLAWGSTYFLKIVAAKARPNGDNRTSFPSGHTMSAFSGAAFIDGRYGRTFGIPSYALALFTGYSRVHSGWHYQDDVLAGASIGMISNWLITSPLPGKIQLLPTVNSNGYGLQVSLGSGGEEPANPVAEDLPRRTSYRFAFGPAFVIKNTASSKGAGETPFHLSDLNGHNDPTTTAVVGVTIPVSSKGGVRILYGPFEARDEGSFTYDVNFGGQNFPANSPVSSAWRYFDLSVMYNHLLMENRSWAVNGGAGIGAMYSYATLASQDGATSALVDDEAFYPFLALTLERRFSDKFLLEIGGEGMTLGDDWLLDVGAEFIWRPARAWDIAAGYRYFSRKIDTDTFFNQVSYNIPFVSISRFW